MASLRSRNYYPISCMRKLGKERLNKVLKRSGRTMIQMVPSSPLPLPSVPHLLVLSVTLKKTQFHQLHHPPSLFVYSGGQPDWRNHTSLGAGATTHSLPLVLAESSTLPSQVPLSAPFSITNLISLNLLFIISC